MLTPILNTSKDVFERFEKKFLLTASQYEKFLQGIAPYMKEDHYGLHTICNIYYDTKCYDLVRRSIASPKYKEKLRLRSYGIPKKDSTVFLEIKKKFDKTVYKRRISLTLSEAENYLNRGVRPPYDSQILNEIDYFIDFYTPRATLYLAYERRAYFFTDDPSIRMTFDSDIRSRHVDLSLKTGDFGTPLLVPSTHLLEIKVPSSLPLWLVHLLSQLSIYPISFSKYGNIYKRGIYNERGDFSCFPAF